jgi:hypothetical protein
MSRRRVWSPRLVLALGLWISASAVPRVVLTDGPVEQWGIYEVALNGPATGNPFTEVELSARFTRGDRAVDVAGFYDGEGVYRVRFMPELPGEWRYMTRSNRPELDGKAGHFEALKPTAGNHGPVRVRPPTPTARHTSRSGPPATSGPTRAIHSKNRRWPP